jgi:ribosomal protein S18 acetylase RimI-like enzyme
MAWQELGATRDGRVCLAQALPEPHETWAVEAFVDAGFIHVGDLAYLRRTLDSRRSRQQRVQPAWPAGIAVRQVAGLDADHPDRPLLVEALERSYEATLDCPELCGLRQTADVLESHRATGVWNPALWWLIFWQGQPHGCMLFNECPDQHSVELVYLGLSPQLRGKRIGSSLLALGLSQLAGLGAGEVACAVDRRNGPALRLYERAGFREFTGRVALVKPV